MCVCVTVVEERGVGGIMSAVMGPRGGQSRHGVGGDVTHVRDSWRQWGGGSSGEGGAVRGQQWGGRGGFRVKSVDEEMEPLPRIISVSSLSGIWR